MNTLLASILIATLTVNTEWQDVPSDTHLGTVLNLGNGPVFVSNVAEKIVAKYDETNLTGRIGVKYEKPAGGIPMTDLAPTVYNAIYGKQDALVSGTNIKTINNQSILGSGNLIIEGGSGGTSNYERLNNKPVIGGATVVGSHSIEYYGGQKKINDYTTTNAVRSIVTSYGYVTGVVTNGLASMGYVNDATNMLKKVAHTGSYNDLTNKPTALKNPNPLNINIDGVTVSQYDGSTTIPLAIPTKLPNPRSLFFTGSVATNYDGSKVVTIAIPTIASTDITFSNATVAVVNDMANRSVTEAVDAAMADILGSDWKTTYGGGLAGLIAALVAALTWLKTHKQNNLTAGTGISIASDTISTDAVRSFLAVGSQTPTVSGGVADLSTLFSGANTSLTSTIGSTIAARCQSLDPVNSSISDVIKALKGIN